MATTKHHVEYSKIDSSGNVKILYPKNTLEDVYINSSSTATLVNKVNFYGTCSTAQGTAAKVVSGTGFTNANLVAGAHVTVKFTYAAVAGATLNVDSTGAKAIYKNNAAVTAAGWPAGSVVTFVYDGTYWQIDGNWSASTSTDGLMTSAMVSKLNGIAAGANAYSHPTSSGNKHIPSGGSSGQILRWSADGTAAWGSDTDTWRGIQNNLTSDSTTDSLSAAQGKVLKGLVDGKAASNHTHSYLPLSGGSMTGSIITPKNDDMGILPDTDNYGQIGSSSKKFYRMYATTFNGNLSGNAASASKVGTSTVGGVNTPIYLNAGVPTACSEFTKKSDFDTLVGNFDYVHGTINIGRKSDTTVGNSSTAEGYATTASGADSHAEGKYTIASGNNSHAEGYYTTASAAGSHAEGSNTTASGNYGSHAEGYYTTASGAGSHAEGKYTIAKGQYQHVQGEYNVEDTASAFIIGNGHGNSGRSNAFSVKRDGVVKAASTITASTTADYAEFFEWQDGNINNEDRVGYFVTIDGDKIRIATDKDDYILGIVSGNPFVLGNGDCDTWNGMYLRDEFGRIKYEPAPKIKEILDENGNPTGKFKEIKGKYEGTRPILNPKYDSTKPYISRFDRPEWSAIGMLGILAVYDDGTCKVNEYCKVTSEGIATHSDIGYRVIERVTKNIIRVIFK